MRVVLTTLALGLLMVARPPIRADDLPAPGHPTAAGKQSVYTTSGRLRQQHSESVLMNPRSAMSSGGNGWLLHSGKGQRDACDNPDATRGLRMMCIGW